MRKRRIKIYEVLRPAHLQAIGRVAAEWSYLEFAVLKEISRLSGTDLPTVIVMTAPSNLMAWNDMLVVLSRWHPGFANIGKTLEKMCEHMKDLQTERNSVVH